MPGCPFLDLLAYFCNSGELTILIIYMRKLLAILFAAALIAVVGVPNTVKAAQVNKLIKGSSSTVYWAANDGKKYTFPNIATFYTWFTSNDLKAVKKLTTKELNSIPTAGNVTYRGGAKLVKFPNEATVYAVSRYSVLRPIASEQVATQIYGWNWSSVVETLPWNLRNDYTIGSTIYEPSTYSASNEYHGVKTPTDNLSHNVPVPPFYPGYQILDGLLSGTVQVNVGTRMYAPERVPITVTVTNANRIANQLTIQIKNATRNEVIQTCYAVFSCTGTWNIDTVATQEIVALVTDSFGQSLASNRVSVLGLGTGSNWYNYNNTYPYYYNNTYPSTQPYYGSIGTVNLSLSNTAPYTNEQVTVYSSATSYQGSASQLTTEIFVDNTRIGTCQNTSSCTLTFNNPSANVTRDVYAKVTDNYGNVAYSSHAYARVTDKPNPWTSGTFSADRTLTAEWINNGQIRLTGRISNANRQTQDLRITLIDQTTGQNVKHCVGTDYCTVDLYTDGYSITTSRYALLAFDMNGQQLAYVYPSTIVNSNNYWNNGYNNGNYYGTPTVTTEVYRNTENYWSPTYTVTGRVNNISNVSNSRLELYAVDSNNWSGNYNRLINTCYGVQTCTAQDVTSWNGNSMTYFTTFVDGNGQRTNSATRSY